VSFDVFGDFETRGYLRNSEGLKDPAEVKRLEHRSYRKNIGAAIEHLRHVKQITYQDILDTHKILFQDVYPWAGQDRLTTAPNIGISKGGRDDLLPTLKTSRPQPITRSSLGMISFTWLGTPAR
jgi:cell filamentation protein